VLVYSWFST